MFIFFSYKLKAFYKYFLQNSFLLSSFSVEKWQQSGMYTWHLTPLESWFLHLVVFLSVTYSCYHTCVSSRALYIAAFQRPGTAEIKPRQGPGEQTGPGSRPGVMKWKMFTPQAALQCTCTNRMRPAPAPSQGPNYLKTSLYGFALSSPQSTALRPTMEIRNKDIKSGEVRGGTE